jgi:23S rRNA pseudouridine1911/1915/1917 synthase
MTRTLTVTTAPEDAGRRLDRVLADHLPDLSRARLQALLAAGEVERDGVPITEGSSRVKPGQSFCVHLPAPVAARPAAEAIPLDILFEDEHLLVLHKPAGVVVHPAPGHAGGTLVNALLAHCAGSLSGIGGVLRPGIVHRLDKDVSGVMVVAKHDRAHIGLAAQFSVHRIERVYDALVWGRPPRPRGTIEASIGRDPRHRKRMAVVASGKRAVTHYRMRRAAGERASWLELSLATGRTHQIRVHLASIGLGVIGDPLYRPRRMPIIEQSVRERIERLGRIMLHARRLGFEHPMSGQKLSFEQPAPPLFDDLFGLLCEERAR